MKEFKLDEQVWSDYINVTETINGSSLTRGIDYFIPGVNEKLCYEDRYKNYFKNKVEEAKGYGLLYRYEVVKDLIPKGWRLPTSDDFRRLKTIIAYHNYKRKDLEEIWNLKFPGLYDIRSRDWNLKEICFLMGSEFNCNPKYLMGCCINEFITIDEYYLHNYKNHALSIRLIKI